MRKTAGREFIEELIILTSLLVASAVTAYEIYQVDDMKLDITVKELVTAVCDRMPMTSTKKCVKKKLKCINKDYSHGEELTEAIFDCF